jgi:hypothetical protein
LLFIRENNKINERINRMKCLKYFILIFGFAAMYFFAGCSDSSTSPSTNEPTPGNVTGKIIDAVGNGLINVTVVIGDKIKTTDANGNFTIENVTTPYDLKVITTTATPPRGYGIVYKSVTTRNPQVLGIGIPTTVNSTQLTASIPQILISNNQKAKIIFTDSLTVQADGLIDGSLNQTSTTFTISWLGSAPQISGKVIALVYTMDANGHILSYNLYGDKPYTLNSGSPSFVAFGENELPIPPTQSTIQGSVFPPGGYVEATAYLGISFITTNSYPLANLYTGSATQLDSKLAPAYIFNVPTNLPTTNKLSVTGTAFVNSVNTFPYEFTSKTIVCPEGTSNNNISLETVSNLISPQNNATLIDTNSNFSYSTGGSGSGLYLIQFTSSSNTIYVFTTLNVCNIPNLSTFGLNIGPNYSYSWYVIKLLGITSSDDILSGPIVNNNHFAGYTSSELRLFTTHSEPENLKVPPGEQKHLSTPPPSEKKHFNTK